LLFENYGQKVEGDQYIVGPHNLKVGGTSLPRSPLLLRLCVHWLRQTTVPHYANYTSWCSDLRITYAYVHQRLHVSGAQSKISCRKQLARQSMSTSRLWARSRNILTPEARLRVRMWRCCTVARWMWPCGGGPCKKLPSSSLVALQNLVALLCYTKWAKMGGGGWRSARLRCVGMFSHYAYIYTL